jgi:hypothetical protein
MGDADRPRCHVDQGFGNEEGAQPPQLSLRLQRRAAGCDELIATVGRLCSRNVSRKHQEGLWNGSLKACAGYDPQNPTPMALQAPQSSCRCPSLTMSMPASAMSAVELMPAPMATPVACRCSSVSGRQPESSNACTGRGIGRKRGGRGMTGGLVGLLACKVHHLQNQPASGSQADRAAAAASPHTEAPPLLP